MNTLRQCPVEDYTKEFFEEFNSRVGTTTLSQIDVSTPIIKAQKLAESITQILQKYVTCDIPPCSFLTYLLKNRQLQPLTKAELFRLYTNNYNTAQAIVPPLKDIKEEAESLAPGVVQAAGNIIRDVKETVSEAKANEPTRADTSEIEVARSPSITTNQTTRKRLYAKIREHMLKVRLQSSWRVKHTTIVNTHLSAPEQELLNSFVLAHKIFHAIKSFNESLSKQILEFAPSVQGIAALVMMILAMAFHPVSALLSSGGVFLCALFLIVALWTVQKYVFNQLDYSQIPFHDQNITQDEIQFTLQDLKRRISQTSSSSVLSSPRLQSTSSSSLMGSNSR